MKRLLAIDLGHRSGFAVFGDDGRLHSYRSTNFGSARRMKQAAWGVLSDVDDLAWVVAEGDRNLADVWEKTAGKFSAEYLLTNAEEWRRELLYKRQRRSGALAKDAADELAREVIEWSNADRPTSLRHDAAEAILIGLWGVTQAGWLSSEVAMSVLGRG
jgi:hypothetical protein